MILMIILIKQKKTIILRPIAKINIIIVILEKVQIKCNEKLNNALINYNNILILLVAKLIKQLNKLIKRQNNKNIIMIMAIIIALKIIKVQYYCN